MSSIVLLLKWVLQYYKMKEVFYSPIEKEYRVILYNFNPRMQPSCKTVFHSYVVSTLILCHYNSSLRN